MTDHKTSTSSFPTIQSVVIDGRAVSFYCHIAENDKTPVLLLHGGGIDRASLSWKYLLPELSKHTSVVAPDWPGHGQSDCIGGVFNLDDLGDWLVRFLDKLGVEVVDVLGVSMGGGAALWLAINQACRVRRVVAVDSYGLQTTAPPSQLIAYLLTRTPVTTVSQFFLRRSRGLMSYSLKHIFANNELVTDTLVTEAVGTVRECNGLRAFANFQRGEVTPTGLRGCQMESLHRIVAPTLLIHGNRDAIVPLSCAIKAVDSIPNAKLLELNAGHWPMREIPEIFNKAVLDFFNMPTTT